MSTNYDNKASVKIKQNGTDQIVQGRVAIRIYILFLTLSPLYIRIVRMSFTKKIEPFIQKIHQNVEN